MVLNKDEFYSFKQRFFINVWYLRNTNHIEYISMFVVYREANYTQE